MENYVQFPAASLRKKIDRGPVRKEKEVEGEEDGVEDEEDDEKVYYTARESRDQHRLSIELDFK